MSKTGQKRSANEFFDKMVRYRGSQRLFIIRCVLRVLTRDAILNSWSAKPLATGGRLSRTAPFVNMAPNGTVSFCADFGCSNRKSKHK